MSIKIDPETQKAVDPESIGKNDFTRLVYAALAITFVLWAWSFCH